MGQSGLLGCTCGKLNGKVKERETGPASWLCAWEKKEEGCAWWAAWEKMEKGRGGLAARELAQPTEF
jgi:hypothetical protein